MSKRRGGGVEREAPDVVRNRAMEVFRGQQSFQDLVEKFGESSKRTQEERYQAIIQSFYAGADVEVAERVYQANLQKLDSLGTRYEDAHREHRNYTQLQEGYDRAREAIESKRENLEGLDQTLSHRAEENFSATRRQLDESYEQAHRGAEHFGGESQKLVRKMFDREQRSRDAEQALEKAQGTARELEEKAAHLEAAKIPEMYTREQEKAAKALEDLTDPYNMMNKAIEIAGGHDFDREKFVKAMDIMFFGDQYEKLYSAADAATKERLKEAKEEFSHDLEELAVEVEKGIKENTIDKPQNNGLLKRAFLGVVSCAQNIAVLATTIPAYFMGAAAIEGGLTAATTTAMIGTAGATTVATPVVAGGWRSYSLYTS